MVCVCSVCSNFLFCGRQSHMEVTCKCNWPLNWSLSQTFKELYTSYQSGLKCTLRTEYNVLAVDMEFHKYAII
jgi:hypothetical protein